MTRDSQSPDSKKFFLHPLHGWLIGAFALWWILMAINPLDRADWLLENLLVFAAIIAVALFYRRLEMNNIAYIALTLFMCLHVYGSHYTYADTPAGFWLAEVFHTDRNHYDRVVHFSFGLLMSWPMREAIVHILRKDGVWPLVSTVIWISALSTFYELIEWLVVLLVAPETGIAFLGTQGDVFDAQKDTGLAILGAIISMTIAAFGIGKPRLSLARTAA